MGRQAKWPAPSTSPPRFSGTTLANGRAHGDAAAGPALRGPDAGADARVDVDGGPDARPGTGANAAVFSFVDALLFKPAPGIHPQRPLVAVYTSDFSSGPYGASSYPDFVSHSRPRLDGVRGARGARRLGAATLRVGDDLQRVRVARVTAEYFDVLGVEDGARAACSARPTRNRRRRRRPSSGTRLWRRAFASDPAAVGHDDHAERRAFTIVGVAPPRFSGIDAGRSIEVWMPLDSAGRQRDARRSRPARPRAAARRRVAPEARAQLDGARRHSWRASIRESNLGTLERPKEPRPFTVIPATRIIPQQRAQVAMVAAVLMGGVGTRAAPGVRERRQPAALARRRRARGRLRCGARSARAAARCCGSC